MIVNLNRLLYYRQSTVPHEFLRVLVEDIL